MATSNVTMAAAVVTAAGVAAAVMATVAVAAAAMVTTAGEAAAVMATVVVAAAPMVTAAGVAAAVMTTVAVAAAVAAGFQHGSLRRSSIRKKSGPGRRWKLCRIYAASYYAASCEVKRCSSIPFYVPDLLQPPFFWLSSEVER